MKKINEFETIGSIAKEETLKSVDHNIIQNTFVLFNLEPFPGYHGENLPDDKHPDTVFLVTSKKYSTEKIIRTSQHIRKFMKVDFDAGPGRICVYNDTYFCIRIRELKSFEAISEIQSGYMDEGIQFMKKKNLNATALILLKKAFLLNGTDNEIFTDLEDPSMFYLRIPYQLTWQVFKAITKIVKNNMDNTNFDAALGYFYMREIVDFIRIYVANYDMEKLHQIRKKYLEEITRYFQA